MLFSNDAPLDATNGTHAAPLLRSFQFRVRANGEKKRFVVTAKALY
jgi:hypothetical protein